MGNFADRPNPSDPLIARGAPDQGADLMARMARQCDGFSMDAVESAAVNLLINALRQRYATSGEAEDALDQLAVRAKEVLLGQHYRPGRFGLRKQGSFAFAQSIVVGGRLS